MSDFQITEAEKQDRHDLLLATGINPHEMPKHIAIIMDGNGRWAKNRGKNRIFGHLNGVESVRAVVEAALQTGVRYLTLYAFSTENWNRPKEEVAALMDLLVTTLVKETEDLKGKGVCLSTIGDLEALPKDCQVQLKSTAELNPKPHRLDLILALNYSSKWELTEAVKDIIRDGVSEDEVNSEMFESYLKTAGIPDPELMIRTSGEHRISNFMLWQLAYTEFHFTPVLWPDFRREHFLAAIYDFQNRERRFGGVPQQTDK